GAADLPAVGLEHRGPGGLVAADDMPGALVGDGDRADPDAHPPVEGVGVDDLRELGAGHAAHDAVHVEEEGVDAIRGGVDGEAVLDLHGGLPGGGGLRVHCARPPRTRSTGVGALGPEVERVVVLLGDQPRVTAELVDAVLERHLESGLPAAAVSAGGVLQPPVAADRRLWPQLIAAHGDSGLRSVLRAVPGMVAILCVEDDAVDVDTPDDYRRLLAEPE